jgi:16S rRNA (uracil1498-N3)-methyltransferase
MRISLLLAIVKFDRFEWALEKATELGVQMIVPLGAERSEKALVAAAAKRAARWQRLLLESAQQARCLRVPHLATVLRPREAFQSTDASLRVLLSERSGARRLRRVFMEQAGSAQALQPMNFALAVGPEGGWTESELSAATFGGFCEASLGDQVLRTETAVVAGLAATHLYFDPD